MWVVEVVPFTRSLRGTETLTYYTATEVSPGDMVRVPLRRRVVPAIVAQVTPVAQAKADVRKAPFRLKRIVMKTAHPWIPPAFIAAMKEEARWSAAPLSALLRATIAQALIDAAAAYKKEVSLPAPVDGGTTTGHVAVLQDTTPHRLQEYHTLARESFAQRASLCIMAPTIEEAEQLFAYLEHRCAPYAVILHSGLKKRALKEAFDRIFEEPHPLVIVLTPSFLPIPRSDIHTLIIDREASPFYTLPSQPHLHVPQYAERYALLAGWRVIRAELPLTVATFHRWEKGEVHALRPLAGRVTFPAPAEVVSMRTHPPVAADAMHRRTQSERERRAMFSPQLEGALRDVLQRRGRAVLFAARRGHAPLTVCDDCGASIVCDSCGATLATHRSGTRAYHLCHACGAMRPAAESCRVCGSWRLTSLGVATHRVAAVVRELFPEAAVFILDSDHTPTRTEAHNTIAQFYASNPAVLIGTQKMLPLFQLPVDLTAIVSFDTILSLPSWNVEERALAIGFALREGARHQTIIQTRLPTDTPLFQALTTGNVRPWYRATLELRERLGYPPFAVLVRVSVSGSRTALPELVATVERQLPQAFFSGKSRPFATRNNRLVQHLYLRFPPHHWPNEEVLALIQQFPPSVSVSVNPPSIIT